MKSTADRPKTILKRRKILIDEAPSNVIPLTTKPKEVDVDPEWAEWFHDKFNYKSYFDLKSGRSKAQFVAIPFHMYGPLMFRLPVKERVLMYLIYRWCLSRQGTFMKPDYAELAKHLLCHKSAVYRAVNYWLKLGLFKVMKAKNGTNIFSLDDEPDLWLKIFPAGKQIIPSGKKISQEGKNVFHGGKNMIAEKVPEYSDDGTFPTSVENPKKLLKNFNDDLKMGKSSAESFREEARSAHMNPPASLHPGPASPPADESVALPARPPDPNYAPQVPPARRVPRRAENASELDDPTIVDIVYSTLRNSHAALFPSYLFTDKDQFGFRKAARLLEKIPDDRIVLYTQKHDTAAAARVNLAQDYARFIKDLSEEFGWNDPHGGNYCSEENVGVFTELIRQDTYINYKIKKMEEKSRLSPFGLQYLDTPEYRKEWEEKKEKLRSQYREWVVAFEKGERPCFGKKNEKNEGAYAYYGDDEYDDGLCLQCRKMDYEQWHQCRVTGPSPYGETRLSTYNPDVFVEGYD